LREWGNKFFTWNTLLHQGGRREPGNKSLFNGKREKSKPSSRQEREVKSNLLTGKKKADSFPA